MEPQGPTEVELPFVYDPSQGDKIKCLPFVPTDTSAKGKTKLKNSIQELPGQQFKLRGQNYMQDKVKFSSKESAFELVGFSVLRSPKKLWHVAENLSSLKTFLAEFPDDFFFVTVRIVPCNPKVSVVVVARKKQLHPEVSSEESELKNFEHLFQKYINEEDSFKNQRLKYIAKLENAPWMVLNTVRLMGGEKPVLMGNGYLKQEHYRGDNYYEVDVDISSSYVARQIAGSVTKFSHLFKIGECFVIEGREESELPERALFSYSLEGINIKAISYELTEEDTEFFDKNEVPTK